MPEMRPARYPANPERLPQRPGEMVIGFTTSPEGRPCIGMNFEGHEWALIATMGGGPMARSAQKKLKENFNIDSKLGWAFERKNSLRNHKLNSVDNYDHAPAQGIYVSVTNFDRLLDEDLVVE